MLIAGKAQSDPIEGRFGYYQQLNGANFFMSVRQLLEVEKKICVLNLLQQKSLTSYLNNLDSSHSIKEMCAATDISWLEKELVVVTDIDQYPTDDASVIFYVGGALGRSVVRETKCDSCKSLLLGERLFDIGEFADAEQSHVNVQPDIHRNLLQFADCGGLVPPSEYTYMVCILAFAYFQQIECNVSLMSHFMQSSNQCAIFLSVVHHMLCSSACNVT